MAFIKKKENFTCEHCGNTVRGSGYTNHCPKCLWSRHVDIEPGDREEACRGLMKPVGIELKRNVYRIIHVCQKCFFRSVNMTAPDDSTNEIIRLSSENTK